MWDEIWAIIACRMYMVKIVFLKYQYDEGTYANIYVHIRYKVETNILKYSTYNNELNQNFITFSKMAIQILYKTNRCYERKLHIYMEMVWKKIQEYISNMNSHYLYLCFWWFHMIFIENEYKIIDRAQYDVSKNWTWKIVTYDKW